MITPGRVLESVRDLMNGTGPKQELMQITGI
jgi:hypothetical protein